MFKRLFLSLIVLVSVSVIGLIVTGNGFVLTSIQRTYLAGHTTANIDDARNFNVNKIKTGRAKAIDRHPGFNSASLPEDFEAELKQYKTAAYMVIKDGQVISEHYFTGYNERSKTNSFSMAKTVTTLLVGIAIAEGHIDSFDQAITDFLPEFNDDPIGRRVTLAHLSLMNSGYEWDENYYSPFSPTVELYYGPDVSDYLVNRSFSAEPGTHWEYSSASTQLLAIALLRALKKAGAAQTLSEYLSEKIWQPLQMNEDALWHTDSKGMELAYCCLNTNAENYAKLGLLMLNSGVWNGQQIIPEAFVAKMIEPDGRPYYGYSTWLGYDQTIPFYAFVGHLGQYIIVVPSHNMVIVRLGQTRNNRDPERHLFEINDYINTAISLAQQTGRN